MSQIQVFVLKYNPSFFIIPCSSSSFVIKERNLFLFYLTGLTNFVKGEKYTLIPCLQMFLLAALISSLRIPHQSPIIHQSRNIFSGTESSGTKLLREQVLPDQIFLGMSFWGSQTWNQIFQDQIYRDKFS